MKLVEGRARWHLRRAVVDPMLRKKLTPDYTLGLADRRLHVVVPGRQRAKHGALAWLRRRLLAYDGPLSPRRVRDSPSSRPDLIDPCSGYPQRRSGNDGDGDD